MLQHDFGSSLLESSIAGAFAAGSRGGYGFHHLIERIHSSIFSRCRSLGFRRVKIKCVLALTIVSVGVVCSTPGFAGENEVKALVAKKTAILERMHKKARKALVNAAQDRAFSEYFTAPDSHHQQVAKNKIENMTLNVQRDFHVEEMCLIAPSGVEITRIVGNRIAADFELAADEADANFFEPGFSLAPKRVLVSQPYMSPDADKWVIAYVTPVTLNGDKVALLHYEHDLDVYQKRLNDGLSGTDRFVLLASKDGYVIADSREPVGLVKQEGKEAPDDYFVKLDSIANGKFGRFLSESDDETDGFAVIVDRGDQYAVAFQRIGDGSTILAIEKQ